MDPALARNPAALPDSSPEKQSELKLNVGIGVIGTILSLFKYSRDMESEADAMGAKLIAEAGYDPMEASNVWLQLIGEEPPPKAWVRGRPLQLLLQRDFEGFEAALAEYRERGHIIRKRED